MGNFSPRTHRSNSQVGHFKPVVVVIYLLDFRYEHSAARLKLGNGIKYNLNVVLFVISRNIGNKIETLLK